MEREQIERLLAEYATGGLTEEERKALFDAALRDQELFNQLVEEDALRELVEMPGARSRLIHSLEEESSAVSVAAAAALPAAPVAKEPRRAMWPFAWAAGMAIVFVSGAVTYLMFEQPEEKQIAGVSRPETAVSQSQPKAFEPPRPANAAPGARSRAVVVEQPPAIAEEARSNRRDAASAPVETFDLRQLPAAPPAAAPPPARVEVAGAGAGAGPPLKDRKANELEAPAGLAKEAVSPRDEVKALNPPPPPQLRFATGEADSAKRELARAAPAAKTAPARIAAVVQAFVWRKTGEGVWTRLPAGTAVDRGDTLVVRLTPSAAGTVTLASEQGRALATAQGSPGEELEIAIPAAALREATGNQLVLLVAGNRIVLTLR